MQDNSPNPVNAGPGGFLIVDDVSINIFVTEEMLAHYGVPIDSATSGFEAVDKIKSGNVYDIIFMDHMMPGMNGLEATKAIRETGYKGCIIALTANEPEEVRVYTDHGFNKCLTKPIDEDLLDKLVNNYVDLSAYSGTDTVRERELTEVEAFFLMDADDAIGVLDGMFASPENVKKEDMETYDITMHGIKSALNNIGETALSEQAHDLEMAVTQGDYKKVFEETPGFIKKLKDFVDSIRHASY